MSNKKKLKAVSIALAMFMIASVLGGCTTFDNFKKTFVDKPLVYMSLALENLKSEAKRKSEELSSRILFIAM